VPTAFALRLAFTGGGAFHICSAFDWKRAHDRAPGAWQGRHRATRGAHYDTMCTADGCRPLRRCERRRIVLGSDYSFPPADLDPVGTVRKAGFSEMETAKILDYNACELMPRLSTQ
jgi:hypothetical protein